MQVPALQNAASSTTRNTSSSPASTGLRADAGLASARSGALRGTAAQGQVQAQRLAERAGGVRSAARADDNAFREPGLQQRVGELQQGLAYAERLGQALQGLKNGLSKALVRQQAQPGAALEQQLATVQQLWQARAKDGAGQLDAQLQTVAEGEPALQRFRLRGLDLETLAQGGNETLRLSLPGQARNIHVTLDGQGLQQQLQQLRGALAPTALKVETGGGQLQFSVAEAQWPALRDGLSLKGDGKRFPSGQMVRALLEPQADAIVPAAWRLEGTEAQRNSLIQVLDAQEQLGQARRQLGASLAAASGNTAANAAEAASAAPAVQRFAADFAARGEGAPLDYGQLSALTPALLGLHRSQVQQLLLLRSD